MKENKKNVELQGNETSGELPKADEFMLKMSILNDLIAEHNERKREKKQEKKEQYEEEQKQWDLFFKKLKPELSTWCSLDEYYNLLLDIYFGCINLDYYNIKDLYALQILIDCIRTRNEDE